MIIEDLQATASDELSKVLRQLTDKELHYVVARMQCDSEQQAATLMGLTRRALYARYDGRWEIIRRAVTLAIQDGVITSLEMRRRALLDAMQVKISGLNSRSEAVRQRTATEIIEWQLGKATQPTELTGKGGGAIPLELFGSAIGRIYGSGDTPEPD